MANAAQTTIDQQEVDQFSKIAEEWWDEHGKFKPLHRINPVRLGYIREQAIQHFALDDSSNAPFTGKRLIDIGCGGGLISEPMTRMGFDVTGLDASERNIAVATHHAKDSGLAINYQCSSAEALAKEGATYDVVLALEIVEHVADVRLFLESCAALTAPGGMLILSTMNRTFKSLMMAKIGAEYVLRWLPRGTHDWRKFLLPSEIEHVLTGQGMQLADLSGMVFNPLKASWSIHPDDIDVNYLMVCRKTT